jgi:hypothetical protein
MVLRVKNEILSTFNDAGRLRPERERREAGNVKRWLRTGSKSGPASTLELPTGKPDE